MSKIVVSFSDSSQDVDFDEIESVYNAIEELLEDEGLEFDIDFVQE